LTGTLGFTSHRSIWITQIFRDDFFGDLPVEPDPFGFSVTLGNTYTLPNDFDTISWSAGYSRDRISPSQQFGQITDPVTGGVSFGPVIGDDIIETISTGLTGNFYLTNKITSEWFVRASFISDRDVRLQYRLKTAWKIVDKLTLRSEFGATIENPNFEAFYGGVTLTYRVLDSLSLSAGYRLYSDTGDVTPSNGNNAAPAFDSEEISGSIFWSNGNHAVSASVAFVQTEFGAAVGQNGNFSSLFSDRDFVAIRAAYTLQF